MKSKSLSRKIDYCICTFMIIGTITIVGSATLLGAKLLEEANLRLRTSEVNSIREGIVTAKDHTEGYTYYKTSYTNKVPITMPHIVPALYTMTISIEENDEKTEKIVDVSEEYNSYEIGRYLQIQIEKESI